MSEHTGRLREAASKLWNQLIDRGIYVLSLEQCYTVVEAARGATSGIRGQAMSVGTGRLRLCERITDYLIGGGLWNPEGANHDEVRNLLIDCRDALAAVPPAAQRSVWLDPELVNEVPAPPAAVTDVGVRTIPGGRTSDDGLSGANPVASIPESGAPSSEAAGQTRVEERVMAAALVDPERVAQMIAHRACIGLEHDPVNGKLHGYCVVCGVPWPCEYAGPKPRSTDWNVEYSEPLERTLAEMPPAAATEYLEPPAHRSLKDLSAKEWEMIKAQVPPEGLGVGHPSGGDRAMASASEVLNVAKARLEEATNWHQFGKEHDEEGWCCKREADLRNTVMAIQQLQEAPTVDLEAGGPLHPYYSDGTMQELHRQMTRAGGSTQSSAAPSDGEIFQLACKLVDTASEDRKIFWLPVLSQLCEAVRRQHAELRAGGSSPAQPRIPRCMERSEECGQCELREGHEGQHLAGYLMWSSDERIVE
jgi:hypothetical protein